MMMMMMMMIHTSLLLVKKTLFSTIFLPTQSWIDMYGDRFTIDDNDDIIPYDDDADDDKPIKIQTAQRKMNAILAG